MNNVIQAGMIKLTKTRGPGYWEDRAEEILVRIDETKDEGARRILWRIYSDYLRLAALAGDHQNLAGEEPDFDAAIFKEALDQPKRSQVNFDSSQALDPSQRKD
jgi:hypothetical protein